jgi:hypothetical protein
MEAGAFLAGFSLASSHYRDAISARLTGIRDFLLLFFFIDLGSRLDLSTMGEDLLPAFILSTFVLVGNPLIVMAIMGAMGYRKRTGFLAGLTVAQISEFSIIFIAMGIGIGHISNNTLGLVTMVGLLTIALSVYMILYAGPLFEKLSPWLSFFERKQAYREMNAEKMLDDADSPPDVIVIGLGRYGRQLAAQLKTAGLDVLGLDLDPEAAQDSRRLGIRVKFGDAIDAELIATLPLHSQGWIVSTLPDFDSNRTLLRLLRESQYGGELVFVARDDASGMALKGIGASIVLYTLRDAVNRATEVLTKLVLERRST